MSELELTVKHTIAASREKVFSAWLSPETLSKFMRTAKDGLPSPKVETNPVNGGRFLIVMVTPEKEIPHSGTYLEIVPHSRLAFTWESPHSLDDSVVTIDFAEVGPNSTEITLHQIKFRSEQARNGHIGGWNAIIGNLIDLYA